MPPCGKTAETPLRSAQGLLLSILANTIMISGSCQENAGKNSTKNWKTCRTRKSLAEFAPAGANKVQNIFAGGVYVGKNTSRLANVRAKRVRCGEPQPFQTRAQRSGSRLRAWQKYFFDTLKCPEEDPSGHLLYNPFVTFGMLRLFY